MFHNLKYFRHILFWHVRLGDASTDLLSSIFGGCFIYKIWVWGSLFYFHFFLMFCCLHALFCTSTCISSWYCKHHHPAYVEKWAACSSNFITQSSRSRLAMFFDMHSVRYCKMSYFPKGVLRMSRNLDQTQQDHKLATANTSEYLYRIIIRYQMNTISSHAPCGIGFDG